MLQRFGNDMNAVQSLQLSQLSANDQLTVKYYHCGKAGKNRVITIRDMENKLLKEFRYGDATTTSVGMAFQVKEILSLKNGNAVSLKLYYTSSELPNGRLLVTIN
jgi:hypothetical protein